MQALSGLLLTLCGAAVLGLLAGYACFHAGMIRSKSVVSVLTQQGAAVALSVVFYLIIGHNLIFHTGWWNGVLPSIHLLWHGKTALASFIDNPIHPALMGELFFSIMTAALIMPIVIGAIAERTKLVAVVLFTVVMSVVIYPVAAFWTGPHGFLSQIGFMDTGGAARIQTVGAMAALAGLLLVGSRKARCDHLGKLVYAVPGSNLPLATLGVFAIWIGFLFLNAGSQLLSPRVPLIGGFAWVMITSMVAACASLFVTLTLVRFFYGKADLTFMLNGLLVGLVAISAGPLVNITGALIVGAIAGALFFFMHRWFEQLPIDDPVGSVAVFGIGGFWGTIAVAFTQQHHAFAELQLQHWAWYQQLWIQLLGFSVVAIWAFCISLLVWWLIRVLIGLRPMPLVETKGLDVVDHGMGAYPEFQISRKR